MLAAIDEMLNSCGGVARRLRLLTVVTRGQLDHEVRSGQLVALFPRALCRPWDADVPGTIRRAALASVGQPAALSHTSALQARELLAADDDDAVHVTVPHTRCPAKHDGLVVHRVRRFPRVEYVDGLITVSAAEALVSSWPLLPPAQRRSPAIVAVRQRVVAPGELRETAGRYPRLTGRGELLALVGMLADGCESELEIWGHERVFDVPGLRHGIRQRVIVAGGRTYRLDLAFEHERVAVEMDGLQHADRGQRESDLRRDSALAAIGWLTVRFTHTRLTRDVAGCRREVLAILAARQGR